ncbi:MAG: 5-amino-6-(D-ribitylamino)uracil--L-tyrosine 4-hydroxyphenyl transferase CofH [Deltaproteobacteria bacterium]|nr:5-amino-6-(D-ribitylamino)uracil--L-tyrosine 4-hydroxyphenyl transferase CofH [Deltaproteobacteria bacterium]
MQTALIEELRSHLPLDRRLAAASPGFRALLERALAGDELDVDDGITCLGAEGDDLLALIAVADAIRHEDVGDDVTYVVNRNINFTNICFVGCRFCAFKRQRWEADAYNVPVDALLAKVQEAVDRGATEICMQGGINPDMEPFTYRDVLRAIKTAFPAIHMHAFSPMEILYGSRRANMSYRDYLGMLKDEGLGTIPGTAAEILDDDVREILSHKKVDVRTWIEIVTTAHELGVRSTSTMMYGHVETSRHIAEHVALLRRLQRTTGGFTEFVPLRFIHDNTELFRDGVVSEPPPKGLYDLRIYAFARLMLRGAIDNVQTSWVKLNHELAQLSLLAGVNDFGGTLMEESISREAGADAGEYTPVAEIRGLIEGMGRRPVERTTLYRKLDGGDERAADGESTRIDGTGGRSGGSEVSPRPAPCC